MGQPGHGCDSRGLRRQCFVSLPCLSPTSFSCVGTLASQPAMPVEIIVFAATEGRVSRHSTASNTTMQQKPQDLDASCPPEMDRRRALACASVTSIPSSLFLHQMNRERWGVPDFTGVLYSLLVGNVSDPQATDAYRPDLLRQNVGLTHHFGSYVQGRIAHGPSASQS